MRLECNMQGLAAFPDNQTLLPSSVPQGIVCVIDATGREYKVLVDQCQSRKVSSVHRFKEPGLTHSPAIYRCSGMLLF